MLPQTTSQTETQQTTQDVVTTTIESNRLIAHTFSHQALIDKAIALGKAAKAAQQAWEALKPQLRSLAKQCLDLVTATSASPAALYLHSSNEDYVEIVPSKNRKTIEPTVLDEARIMCTNELVEETEVVLTGSLAQWAFENLPKMANPNILEDNFTVKRRWLVVDNFKERVKDLKKEAVNKHDPKLLSILDRLHDCAYNAAAVEVKTTKK